jgi:hypothetical protein
MGGHGTRGVGEPGSAGAARAAHCSGFTWRAWRPTSQQGFEVGWCARHSRVWWGTEPVCPTHRHDYPGRGSGLEGATGRSARLGGACPHAGGAVGASWACPLSDPMLSSTPSNPGPLAGSPAGASALRQGSAATRGPLALTPAPQAPQDLQRGRRPAAGRGCWACSPATNRAAKAGGQEAGEVRALSQDTSKSCCATQ